MCVAQNAECASKAAPVLDVGALGLSDLCQRSIGPESFGKLLVGAVANSRNADVIRALRWIRKASTT